jgi:heme/copper-type cytochrome/quinol oxidase subunit 1
MKALLVLRRNAVAVIGGLLLVGGVVFWWTTRDPGTTGAGWYLYGPLHTPPRRYADYGPVSPLSAWSSAGLLVSAVGLATLTGAIGYRLGRRDAARPSPE